MKKTILLFLLSILLYNCQIEQEIKFEENGEGRYTLGCDMSEMVKKHGAKSAEKDIDTLIKFGDFLKEKKDSISKLPKENQEKLKNLEKFDLFIKIDSASQETKMKLGFNFKNVEELKTMGEKLKNLGKKEMNMLEKRKPEKLDELLSINKLYDASFSNKKFSYQITKEALKEMTKEKDTTKTNDNLFFSMITFKQIVRFPYKIKSISSDKYKITSDFKGIEQTIQLFDLNNKPKTFDVDVEFE